MRWWQSNTNGMAAAWRRMSVAAAAAHGVSPGCDMLPHGDRCLRQRHRGSTACDRPALSCWPTQGVMVCPPPPESQHTG